MVDQFPQGGLGLAVVEFGLNVIEAENGFVKLLMGLLASSANVKSGMEAGR